MRAAAPQTADHRPGRRRRHGWPWPGGVRGAAGAVALALLVGILVGVAAGPPAASSTAVRRVVVTDGPATSDAAGLPTGGLAALQATPPAAPPVEPATSSGSGETGAAAAASASTNDDSDAPASAAPTPAAAKPKRATTGAPASTKEEPVPPVKHVVVVMLADKGFDQAFGRGSNAPYLARELPKRGVLLRRYFATAHGSLPNYLALLTGQASNAAIATGCPQLTPFVAAGRARADGQVRGAGCVFGDEVASLPGQLEAKSLRWHAYVDGAAPAAPVPVPAPPVTPGPCTAPPPAADGSAPVVDRNPFLFVAAVARAADCTAKVTGLAALQADLAAPAKDAPAVTLVVPDACSAGRGGACAAGETSGLARSDAWLREWIPRLLAAPAYADDGMVVVTFDQAAVSGAGADSTSCCGQPLGVNEPERVDPQAPVPGGGRVGALVLSPHVRRGSISDVPHNHFALLRTIEDAFELDHLGLAGAQALRPFGADVFAGR